MKKLITIIAICTGTGLFAQSNYNTAIGLRAGETSGLTIKHFIGDQTALEGILGAWRHGFSATLLFEKHQSISNLGALNLYYGAGGHLAFENSYYNRYYYENRKYYYYDYYSKGGMGIGIDGIIGLEYKIPNIPVAFSLDLKPFVEFNTNGGVWTSIDPGLGIKVAF